MTSRCSPSAPPWYGRSARVHRHRRKAVGADLKDILLLSIYLEFGAMIDGFKSNKLPRQFLIFTAITALARHSAGSRTCRRNSRNSGSISTSQTGDPAAERA
ncbi:MAG: phosphate-starvation-inducible PsiE family protein [Gammaproteobacteria bacterium]|nr:phosphate-starvation-inducible PsiE family protein [Gammaproteobacteria bacterium]